MEKIYIERLLLEYYDNKLSQEESDFVEKWMEQSPENRKQAEDIYKLCYAAEVMQAGERLNVGAALGRVKGNIRSARHRKVFRRIQTAAAVIALPLMALSGYLFSVLNGQSVSTIELQTTTGMISSVILPDNSKVWLNSNSSIMYPAKFKGNERRVTLTGEAYFDVAEERRSRFVVEARNTEVEVYGTQFNVEAYPEDDIIRTTLVEGSVGFRYDASAGQRLTARMVPGQMLRYDTSRRSLYLDTVDAAVSSSWKDGKIILRDTPLLDALRMLGNKYNVTFKVLNEELLDNTYMGSFANQSLDVILRNFTLSSEIHFREEAGEPGEELSGRRIIEVY